MGTAQSPLHLLFLDESSADYLVDRRLHECRANRFPLPSTLAKGMQILLHPADILTAIRPEHHLLILLHALLFHQLPQSPARFLIVRLHESETLRRRHLSLIVPPESDHAFARDHLEPSLLVRPAIEVARRGPWSAVDPGSISREEMHERR